MSGVLPANLSAVSTCVVYVDGLGEPRTCDLLDLAGLAVEGWRPVRDFYAWPGQRTFQGWWWSRTTRTLLAFESLLERQALMAFDFDPLVSDMSVQPFALVWPRDGTSRRYHVPDLFLRKSDGTGVVVDVRAAGLLDERARAQFALTARTCAEIGWDYVVYDELQMPRLQNLQFLSGYRLDRHAPIAAVAEAVLSAFRFPARLDDGALEASLEVRRPLAVTTSACFHLLWTHDLHVDLDTELRSSSTVVAGHVSARR